MPTNERPGVYSSYEVSSVLTGGTGGIAGVFGQADAGTVGTVLSISSAADAAAAFGTDSSLTTLIGTLLLNGASTVLATAAAIGTAPTAEEYAAALTLLMEDSSVGVITCDSRDSAVHAAIKTAIENAGEQYKYRIAVLESSGETAQLVSAAGALNYERIVLVNAVNDKPGQTAAALAGAVLSDSDPALPLNGVSLAGLEGGSALSDSDVNALVRGGVTPIENLSGGLSVVRAVTTRTTTAGTADATWRELTTVRIVDDVIPTIRNALRTRFSRAKNTAQTRGAIRTQVVIELENKLAREIIDSYGSISVAPSAEDPSVCQVSFAFTVAHGLNRVELSAHITV